LLTAREYLNVEPETFSEENAGLMKENGKEIFFGKERVVGSLTRIGCL
jgi:hypothetical protein